jgi:glutathione S-transferase
MRLYDYAASGNCFKVRLLLSLLGAPYERVPVDIFGGDTLTDAFFAINPVRETPVLELSDGTRIAQSSAVLWYLGEGTPFLPSGALERAQVVQWLAFEQERVMSALGGARFRLITGRASEGDPAIVARLATGREALDVLEAHLSVREWVVGDGITIADVGLFAYISVAPVDLDEWPRVSSWLDRIRALRGFVDDFIVYPDNARAGAGASIYA